jgi:integrase
MARSTRSTTLETRSARLRLPVAKKPVFIKLGPQLGLGYRRNQTAGTWVMRVADGKGGNWLRAIGMANDFDDADDADILDFWQAQAKARSLARGGKPAEPLTIGQSLDRYEADLRTRGADTGNVSRVRSHMTNSLAGKLVDGVTARDLRGWRDTLAKDLAPATVNRTTTALKAALNLVADHEERIVSRRAWEIGLASIPGAEKTRNVILTDAQVRVLIAEAYQHSRQFGVLVEVAAVTGARISQLARLTMKDVQDGPASRLMVPVSRKGKGTKAVMRRPVVISPSLAGRLIGDQRRLELRSDQRSTPTTAPLLVKPSGQPWRKSDHSRLFARIARRCGLDPAEVTMYALRHSSIVRQLLAGVPARVVAAGHDTSVVMIERTYSHHIGDHADAIVRGSLLDTG